MKSWGPLIVVLVLVAMLAALFGPGLYRSVLLRRSVRTLTTAAQAGDTAAIVALISPSQQAQASELFGQYLPDNYAERIESFRLTHVSMDDDDTGVTIVTCKVLAGEYRGIYQGQLVWHYRAGRWEWDFLGSAGAEFSPAGEPAWIRLSELVTEAGQL